MESGMNLQTPTVSVIVPVFNTARYLERCLDSILGQTLATIEVLVVDDRSPDDSAEIIRAYASRDNRVVSLRHDRNRGLGGARNTGICAARGKYIASVDSDDAILPNTLEAAVRRCESDRTEIGVFSSSDYLEASGRLEENPFYALDHLPSVLSIDETNILNLFPTFQLKLYSRALIERHAVRFPEHLYHEDDEFYWKLFGCALPCVSVIPQRLYLRTRRSDETSIMDNTEKSRKDMPQVLLNAYRFLSQRGAFERIRKPFVHKVCRNLYVVTRVQARFRRHAFDNMVTLLNELRPTSPEVAGDAWWEEIQAMQQGDYTAFLNWKIDTFQQKSIRLQKDPSISALAELEDVYASTSWKVTAPLRWLAMRLRVTQRQ
jgi:glycosyltransferase involved in cell wall biosynthesis